jgi:hypothetical protein
MIISPPFLCSTGDASEASCDDPLMDTLDRFELAHGIYPIAFDRRWHGGVHLLPDVHAPVHAIADGEVIAYRVCQQAYDVGEGNVDTNAGFVLLKHTTETGDGRSITFYSLYMHLLDLASYLSVNADPKRLPQFLRMPTPGSQASALPPADRRPGPAQAGAGQKVYRKDILGWLGACHGQLHLHFEIFMAQADFEAYFAATQLGARHPKTPKGTDYWGHSYFVIPGGTRFYSWPPGHANSVYFPALQDGQLDAAHTLYVEAYFHQGQRYIRSWLDQGDGQLIPLTSTPEQDGKDYEYALYDRATHLYPACPSDGYELLRFGRILSDPATLADGDIRTPPPFDMGLAGPPRVVSSPNPRATWVAACFAEGQRGYLDINAAEIQKLSDADFPSFMGWQKISENARLYNEDGLCEIEVLKKLLKDTADSQTPQEQALSEEYQKEDVLVRYVTRNDDVRRKLRGFVCKAISEWDNTNNQKRYRKLLEEGEFFHGKQADYDTFIRTLESFQFWDKTDLKAGEPLWFLHPLQFIRHFRRCGWLSQAEFAQIYSDDRYPKRQQPTPNELRSIYLVPLNLASRKYGFTSPIRLSHFLGQGAVESAWLKHMQETSMTGKLDAIGFHGTTENPSSKTPESTLGHWYGQDPSEDDAWYRSVKFNSHGIKVGGSYDWINGNCDHEDAQKFRGRGFKQLTFRSNYTQYWVFRGWISTEAFTQYWWNDPAYKERNMSGMKSKPAKIDEPQRVALPENCIDSGGFYLRFARPNVAMAIDRDNPKMAVSNEDKLIELQISREVTYAINGGYTDDKKRLECTRYAKKILS